MSLRVLRIAICLSAMFWAAEAQAPESVLADGGIIGIADTPSARLVPERGISPGLPPTLSFRVFDAGDRGRLSDVGLMTDDAGH